MTRSTRTTGKKKAPSRGAGARRANAMPREVRAAVAEMRKGMGHLDASIADLRAGLQRAERRIESDARRRIRALRADGRAQLRELQAKQRAAGAMMKRLSAAAGDSWREVKHAADAMLADARRGATAVGKRFRAALKS